MVMPPPVILKVKATSLKVKAGALERNRMSPIEVAPLVNPMVVLPLLLFENTDVPEADGTVLELQLLAEFHEPPNRAPPSQVRTSAKDAPASSNEPTAAN